MRVFNAFQIVVSFVAWPFGIQWLSDAPFRGNDVAFWVAITAYIVAFGFMVSMVTNQLED